MPSLIPMFGSGGDESSLRDVDIVLAGEVQISALRAEGPLLDEEHMRTSVDLEKPKREETRRGESYECDCCSEKETHEVFPLSTFTSVS